MGIEKQRGELHRQLELAGGGEGTTGFLRGGYGCGKTFMARLALLDAQERGFATSFVVVSDNDLKFHRFDDVYRKVMTELGTSSCPGALSDILDRWIARVEDALIAAGEDEDAAHFDERCSSGWRPTWPPSPAGKHPGLHPGDSDDLPAQAGGRGVRSRGAHLPLCGSGNVAAASKKVAGIKGDIGSRDALDLRGVLEIVKAAGYKGLLIVIDEAETILRMRSDSRHKSLNGFARSPMPPAPTRGCLAVHRHPGVLRHRHCVAGLTPSTIGSASAGLRQPAPGPAGAGAV